MNHQVLCQSSGKNIYLLTVGTDGVASVSRYGTTSNIEVKADTWMPFNTCFFANEINGLFEDMRRNIRITERRY